MDLDRLRASLQHFKNSPDFGDREAVQAIQRHLEMRIHEAEGQIRMLEAEAAVRQGPWLQTEAA